VLGYEKMLPCTSTDLHLPHTRPYFLWWTDLTVAQFREKLTSFDTEVRAYWIGALLREANTRDVWQFVSPDEVRLLFPKLVRYLGCSREMWAFLLDVDLPPWPPLEARGA
jgi:hypothetical protein